MDQPKKISEEPVATSIGVNDRIVILYNANTASPSLRTISANNINNTMFANIPTFADNTAATEGGLAVGSIYKTVTGEVRIVV
jgi:hypothetical protein